MNDLELERKRATADATIGALAALAPLTAHDRLRTLAMVAINYGANDVARMALDRLDAMPDEAAEPQASADGESK